MQAEEKISTSLDANQQFSNWASSLESYERVYWFNQIAKACDLTYQTVFKWSINRTRIKKPFVDIINSVVGQQIISI